MSLREFYKPLCESMSAENLEKVGSFAGAFLEAQTLGDTNKMSELLKVAAQAVASDPESLDTLLGVISFSSKYGTPTEKVAAAKLGEHLTEFVKEEHEKVAKSRGWGEKALTHGLTAASVAVGAAPIISHLVDRVSTNSKIKTSLRQVLADHPELRSDPNTPRYFQALVDFSPKVAANALAAGNIMRQMHQVGPGALTPSLIKELSDIGRIQGESRKPDSHAFGSLATALKSMSPKPSSGRRTGGRGRP